MFLTHTHWVPLTTSKKMQKKLLVISVCSLTELFNTAANDFDGKKSAGSSWVLIVTELVVSGTQCIIFKQFYL